MISSKLIKIAIFASDNQPNPIQNFVDSQSRIWIIWSCAFSTIPPVCAQFGERFSMHRSSKTHNLEWYSDDVIMIGRSAFPKFIRAAYASSARSVLQINTLGPGKNSRRFSRDWTVIGSMAIRRIPGISCTYTRLFAAWNRRDRGPLTNGRRWPGVPYLPASYSGRQFIKQPPTVIRTVG